jgi:hypothetical protein
MAKSSEAVQMPAYELDGNGKLVLGWEEWVVLPGLGVPAVRAKIDTGAKTSSIHAFMIEPYGRSSSPRIRFGIHPMPERPEITIYCSAELIDHHPHADPHRRAGMANRDFPDQPRDHAIPHAGRPLGAARERDRRSGLGPRSGRVFARHL